MRRSPGTRRRGAPQVVVTARGVYEPRKFIGLKRLASRVRAYAEIERRVGEHPFALLRTTEAEVVYGPPAAEVRVEIECGAPGHPIWSPLAYDVLRGNWCGVCWASEQAVPEEVQAQVRRACSDRYYQRNAPMARKRALANHRARKYGLGAAEFEALRAAQGGGCALCGRPGTPRRGLHVDHDHVSGAVRALLCGGCNPAIAEFREDPELLRRAAAYLRAGGARG
jgi:hypothetical protein